MGGFGLDLLFVSDISRCMDSVSWVVLVLTCLCLI